MEAERLIKELKEIDAILRMDSEKFQKKYKAYCIDGNVQITKLKMARFNLCWLIAKLEKGIEE